eukprot:1481419-Amphidinium_carterae.2
MAQHSWLITSNLRWHNTVVKSQITAQTKPGFQTGKATKHTHTHTRFGGSGTRENLAFLPV